MQAKPKRRVSSECSGSYSLRRPPTKSCHPFLLMTSCLLALRRWYPFTASRSTSHFSETLTTQQKKLLANPLRVSCNESKIASTLQLLNGPDCSIGSNSLLLPGFVAEYKKWDNDEAKALNQERTYLISAVTILGIKGFPLFGLITSGHIGGAVMAWYSKLEEVSALLINVGAV